MKKGFTLVELMAVILILGVLALITYPIIDNSIKQSKEKALDRTIASVIEAAFNYSIDNDLGYEKDYQILELSVLKNNGFLKQSIINPVTNNELEGCLLYKWNSNDNQYIFEYSETCEIPQPVPNLIDTLLTQYTEENKYGLVKDENYYYYNGTSEEVTNNYLWYGGIQWRIMDFDTNERTLTLLSQQPLTSIQLSNTINYPNYVYDWLNNYFYNILDDNIKNNVLDNEFYVGMNGSDVDYQITAKVGILNASNYFVHAMRYDLVYDMFWYITNTPPVNEEYEMAIEDLGVFTVSISSGIGVRPVIKIKDIVVTDGDGSFTSNFRTDDIATSTNDIQVGEYINVPTSGNYCGNDKMCTFRVVSKDNDSIKVILNGLLPSTSTYGSNSTITTNYTIYTSLNEFANSISNNYRYTENKTFYIGDYPEKTNYLDIKDESLQSSVGLPTVGEMFSGNDIDVSLSNQKYFVDVNTIENPNVSDHFWMMNRLDSNKVYSIDDYGYLKEVKPSESYGVRPVMYLKSNLTFTRGNGTAQSPYILK